jgi:Xaa-Pro aminopeptidase
MDRGLVERGPGAVEDVRYVDATGDPLAVAVKHLKKTDASLVALSGQTWYEEFVPLHAELPKLTFSAAHPYVGALRQVKTTEELRLLQSASRLVQGAVESTLQEVREGMREDEIARRVSDRLLDRGAWAEGTVQSGPNTLIPRSPAGDRRLAAGDTVVASFGAAVRGYWARVSRTAVMGKATGRMRLIHDTLREAQEHTLERVKPDVLPVTVDQVIRATLGRRGLLKMLLHPAGSGCGVEPVEAPYVHGGYFDRLVPGNVFTVGQGVYTPGEYGIRLDDVMAVTADGARWLTSPPSSLIEV